jgi:hypothetical protein
MTLFAPLAPIEERLAQRSAQARPALFQLFLDNRFDLLEVALRDTEQFGEVHYLGNLAEQVAVQHQFGGILFLVDASLQLAVNRAIADDR